MRITLLRGRHAARSVGALVVAGAFALVVWGVSPAQSVAFTSALLTKSTSTMSKLPPTIA